MRAQARTGDKGKNKDDGLTPEQRRERYIINSNLVFCLLTIRLQSQIDSKNCVCVLYNFRDAKALQEKAAKKAAQAAAATSGGGGGGAKGNITKK